MWHPFESRIKKHTTWETGAYESIILKFSFKKSVGRVWTALFGLMARPSSELL
jgi:hypothetical protein